MQLAMEKCLSVLILVWVAGMVSELEVESRYWLVLWVGPLYLLDFRITGAGVDVICDVAIPVCGMSGQG